MLDNVTPTPVLAVKDLAQAQDFYEGKLELPVQEEMPEMQMVIYGCGDGALQVYVSEFAGTNKATAVTWEVSDVTALVDELRSRRVEFEHYPDMPETKLEGDVHVWGDEKAAWFKDPDGNILCLHQRE